MRLSIVSLLLLVTGCAGLPNYVEPQTGESSAGFKVKHDFDAPILGYSTFVYVHTEEQTCGKSFGSESGAKLVVLDDSNPLISELNPDGVKLAASKKYSFMIMSVAGMSNCIIYASFKPKADEYYEMNVSGQLGAHSTHCKAELYRIDETANIMSPVEFQYYGQCREPAE
ncbi:hypothetical protein [Shewanella gelidii]|uniref:Lipoprotein n=1 Tax=Shewanella gelidii TaxID=1642821 RepID=A0A917JWI2_9GAMM|nr:hypothetical protein [Shewanella gelidii]MCL1098553.1 hypothetical protein [Shewanella gelidii]GGI87236.1 hypothetical protein GCM10009332_25590 [Shewanella gelidii]